MKDLDKKISAHELRILKEQYDKDFSKNWTSGDKTSRPALISMEEFKRRLKEDPTFFEKYGKLPAETDSNTFTPQQDQAMLGRMMGELKEQGSIQSKDVAAWWMGRY